MPARSAEVNMQVLAQVENDGISKFCTILSSLGRTIRRWGNNMPYRPYRHALRVHLGEYTKLLLRRQLLLGQVHLVKAAGEVPSPWSSMAIQYPGGILRGQDELQEPLLTVDVKPKRKKLTKKKKAHDLEDMKL